jgi:UDPglucose--hexose-1-phosphate uridylyltransferase
MEPVFDPLGRKWILIAPGRAKRGVSPPPPDTPDPAPCDFCEGREANTPPESYAIRKHGTDPDTPGWRVRVVPNLYPATPFHEVVVHSPDHWSGFERFSHGMRRAVLLAYRERVRACPLPCTVVIVNRGRTAGASRTHDHAQIYGLEHIPPTVARETKAFNDPECVLCSFTQDDNLRVAEIDHTTVVAHPVPTMAHELLVIPPHSPSLADVESGDLGATSDALGEAVTRLQLELGESLPFNLVIHTAPVGVDSFHWHAHIYPRIARWGGLEIGAEMPIVAANPQETARSLSSS